MYRLLTSEVTWEIKLFGLILFRFVFLCIFKLRPFLIKRAIGIVHGFIPESL
jgi:hypothetical protein